jgi:hypothetical protein
MTTIPVGSGLSAQLVAKDEVTYGVAPSLTSGVDSFEMKSDTLELKKTVVTGQGLAAGRVYERTKRRVITDWGVSGNIPLDLPTRNLSSFLRHMGGDVTETPTEVGVTGIYSTVFQPKSAFRGHSFCMQKGVPAVDDATVEPFTYVGCKISGWTISVAAGQAGALSLSFICRNELAASGNSDPLNASVPPLATFATPTDGLGLSLFHFKEAAIYSGGTPTLTSGVVSLAGATALGNVQNISIQQQIGFDAQRQFVGGKGFIAEPVENGYRALTGSMTIEWLSSMAAYEAFVGDTPTSLQLTFTGATVSTSNYLLDIIIPNVEFEGESPKVPGPGVITQAVPFTGTDDEATTPIQITYQSEDVSF